MNKGKQSPGQIRVGVAGWSYPDWRGRVYSRESHFDKLEYHSHLFDTIEVNNSFYAIPNRQMVERWLTSVRTNPNFLFCVKLHKQYSRPNASAGNSGDRGHDRPGFSRSL
jgi:uncharacterized protein YecE (DUF72 family)